MGNHDSNSCAGHKCKVPWMSKQQLASRLVRFAVIVAQSKLLNHNFRQILMYHVPALPLQQCAGKKKSQVRPAQQLFQADKPGQLWQFMDTVGFAISAAK